MQKAYNYAVEAARNTIISSFGGVFSVVERQSVTDEITKITTEKEVTVLKNLPCKLSFTTVTTASQTDTAAKTIQTIKLFVLPDVRIKAGSKVIVTQEGITAEYQCSGIPANYRTHNEIVLEVFRGWA